MRPRCLVLVTTTSYRTDAYLAAARALDVEVLIGSNRCHVLAEEWPDEAFQGAFDGSIQLDFRNPAAAAEQVAEAARRRGRFDAIVASDDVTAIVAALASERLGLPGNAPGAVRAAGNKGEMRARLRAAGVAAPAALRFPLDEDAGTVAAAVREAFGFPCVVKPLLLSGSRGVIRADDQPSLAAALARSGAIARRRPEFGDGVDLDARRLLVEAFVPGVEVALEGILVHGALRTLALYDKPDPLDGPFFEETIYVTPSRLPVETRRRIEATAAAAAAALGLREGPIHAELRLPPAPGAAPVVIEVAARSIGGLCARTLRFTVGGRDEGDHALEELVLRHALGLPTGALASDGAAAGVMMLPVPGAGVLQDVSGIEAAKAVPLVEDVVITAKIGERLLPPPEGASYPGFVFARATRGTADGAALVEDALRQAFSRLRFTVAPAL